MINKDMKRCSTSLGIWKYKSNLYLYIKESTSFARMTTIKKISLNEDVEKLQLSYTTSRDVKLCSYLGKQSGSFSRS